MKWLTIILYIKWNLLNMKLKKFFLLKTLEYLVPKLFHITNIYVALHFLLRSISCNKIMPSVNRSSSPGSFPSRTRDADKKLNVNLLKHAAENYVTSPLCCQLFPHEHCTQHDAMSWHMHNLQCEESWV